MANITYQVLTNILDTIYNNLSNYDRYPSLLIYDNNIKANDKIFEREPDEDIKEVVALLSDEAYIVDANTYKVKLLEHTVYNSSTEIFVYDFSLSSYVPIERLVKNICVSLGVKLGDNFKVSNPGIYDSLINIIRDFFGKKLENNVLTTIRRTGATGSEKYASYIPKDIVVAFARFLNELGIFADNITQVMPQMYVSVLYNSSSSVSALQNRLMYTIEELDYDYIDNWDDFIKIIPIRSAYSTYITAANKDLCIKAVENCLKFLRTSYENEIDLNSFISYSSVSTISTTSFNITFYLHVFSTKDFYMWENYSYKKGTDPYSLTSYTVRATFTDATYETIQTATTTKQVWSIAGDSINSNGNGVDYKRNNISNKYIVKRYSNGDVFTNAGSGNYTYNFIRNPYNTDGVTKEQYKFLPLGKFTEPYNSTNYGYANMAKFLKFNNISISDKDFVCSTPILSSTEAPSRYAFKIFIVRNCPKLSFNTNLSSKRLPDYLGYLPTTKEFKDTTPEEDTPLILINNITEPDDSGYNYTFTFERSVQIEEYTVDRNTYALLYQNTSTQDILSSNIRATNLGEIVENTNSDIEIEDIELISGATYPKGVVDETSFNSKYSTWKDNFYGVNNPWYLSDEIQDTVKLTRWIEINTSKNGAIDQITGQGGVLDAADIEEIAKEIEAAESGDDTPDVEPIDETDNKVTEDIGETPDLPATGFLPRLSSGLIMQVEISYFNLNSLATNFIANFNLKDHIVALQAGYFYNNTGATDGKLQIGVNPFTTDITVKRLYESIVDVDLGSVTISPKYLNYLDYTCTFLDLYIPYIGFNTLPIADFINTEIKLTARIDTISGTVVYSLYSIKNNLKRLIGNYQGVCQTNIPLQASDHSRMLTTLIGTEVALLGGAALGVGTTMGINAVAGSGAAQASGITEEMTNKAIPIVKGAAGAAGSAIALSKPEMRGSIGSNAGFLSVLTPYIVIRRKKDYIPATLSDTSGNPSNSSVILGSCQGFTKVLDCHLEIPGATQGETNEIKQLLESGVII